MSETERVLEIIQELNRRDCNGHAKIKLGRAVAKPERFRKIFERYSRGTYFEKVDLDIEEVPIQLGCGCGYWRIIKPEDEVNSPSCPRCGNELSIEKGNEVEIVKPE
ncbi:MAG: hydrogenase/urease maturation nickel metallochaperone HypA [Candidatus Nanohaloarchaeota archaeon QJJ-9]|nr:hydrogenase/urease maturation nickel metallochaperone HypA [Candidatus Nanohaloarchaeota archaeon QJJ-9]